MSDDGQPAFQATFDGRGVARHLRRAPQDAVARAQRRSRAQASPGTPPEAVPRSARSIAEAFLRDTAPSFLNTRPAARKVAVGPGTEAAAEDTALTFAAERSAGPVATVVFEQSVLGLPIWNHGVTVQVDQDAAGTAAEQVFSLQNQLGYGITLQPAPASGHVPENVTRESLAAILGRPSLASGIRINAIRRLVYCYAAAERTDPHVSSAEAPDALSAPTPTLAPPAVPETMVEGGYYVVTEVLFSMPSEPLGPVPWRVFIEPETGTVLYLRALVAGCFRGSVFVRDPATQGFELGPDAAEADLDRCREIVAIEGLAPASAGGGAPQPLSGEFIRIHDIENPAVQPPVVAPGGAFTFSSHSSEFAAVCAYYNCDRMFRELQGLGFDVHSFLDQTRFPIAVDHAAKPGAWTIAHDSGIGVGAFLFGASRLNLPLGIAACPRVAWHEFGHALLLDKLGALNFGFAHSAGDSLAAILHDPGSKARSRFTTFPFMQFGRSDARSHGRRAEEGWAWRGTHDDKSYGSEQLLSSTLFRFYRMTGGDGAEQQQRSAARYAAYLILQAINMMGFNTSRPRDFLDRLVDADLAAREFDGRSGGRLPKVLSWSFEAQGLVEAEGPVDVFIDDGRAGAYEPYVAHAAESASIWNRQRPDGGPDHEPPLFGQPNFVYARVGNRGTEPAHAARLAAYRTTDPASPHWPDDWQQIGQSDEAVRIDPGAVRVVGPLPWSPEAGENRLLVAVEDRSDPSNLARVAGPALLDDLVPFDNNLATRAFAVPSS